MPGKPQSEKKAVPSLADLEIDPSPSIEIGSVITDDTEMTGQEIVSAHTSTNPMQGIQPMDSTPMGLLQRAVDRGADLATIEKLMDLRDREEATQARRAFVAAMARFKQNAPELLKDKEVAFDSTKYKHAQLGNIVEKIAAGLSEVGISWRWETSQTGSTIRVTCILTHEAGHSESNYLEAAPDASGKKNSIQAVGSTVTYLQRYTLLAATGLATKDQDSDGMIPDMPESTFQGHLSAIRAAETLTALHEVYTTAYKAAGRDQVTQKAIIKAKDERKADLMGVKP